MLAKKYVQEAEVDYFNAIDRSGYPLGPAALIRELLTHHNRSKVISIIERYVGKYPEDEIWTLVFPISTYNSPKPRVERLTAQWISLNVENQNLFLPAVPILTPSPEVANACFAWIRKGGKDNEYMPDALIDILCKPSYLGSIFQDVVDFARKWLNENHNNKESGRHTQSAA